KCVQQGRKCITVYIGVVIDDPEIGRLQVFHGPAQTIVVAACITAVFRIIVQSDVGILLFLQPLLQGYGRTILRIIVDDHDMIEGSAMRKYAFSTADGLSSSLVVENKCDVHVLV